MYIYFGIVHFILFSCVTHTCTPTGNNRKKIITGENACGLLSLCIYQEEVCKLGARAPLL